MLLICGMPGGTLDQHMGFESLGAANHFQRLPAVPRLSSAAVISPIYSLLKIKELGAARTESFDSRTAGRTLLSSKKSDMKR